MGSFEEREAAERFALGVAKPISRLAPRRDLSWFITEPLNALSWLGDLIQGDAGLLWILFLLLVFAAIVGSGS